ncbi:MAG: hypothetical protein KGM93_15645, partial [Sphingomonadales bacterium]|nr:hypothetical protein [Sphingomonadales bacterium]
MNDNKVDSISDARILAALQAVNPPLEKLMADRLALRQDINQTRAELESERHRLNEVSKFRDEMIPRYIGVAKAITLTATTIGLVALATAFFTGLLETRTIASLFASLSLPLWLVELAER